MNTARIIVLGEAVAVLCLICALGFPLQLRPAEAQTTTQKPDNALAAASTTDGRDGQHDFDFEIGRWVIHSKRLLHPLTHSNTWVTPRGFSHTVRKVWGGRASLAELEAASPAPHYVGLMLRLYSPQSHQWSIYWAASKDGTLDAPLVGRFKKGRGEFFSHDVMQGAPIDVRVVYSDITSASFHTEQAFSSDGGKTWEPNLMQTFTRKKP